MNLNLKAQKENTFDAIVIGSGISGGWAAKELTEKELRTLMLEGGRDVKHVQDYPTTMSAPWEMSHRGRLPLEVISQNTVVCVDFHCLDFDVIDDTTLIQPRIFTLNVYQEMAGSVYI